MKLVDIRYEERKKHYGKQLGMVMPGGFWVQKDTMEAALKQVHQNWSLIDWSRHQTAKDLIGAEYWDSQNFGTRLAMGRCIKFFSVQAMLPMPIVVANPRNKGKRFYRPSRV